MLQRIDVENNGNGTRSNQPRKVVCCPLTSLIFDGKKYKLVSDINGKTIFDNIIDYVFSNRTQLLAIKVGDENNGDWVIIKDENLYYHKYFNSDEQLHSFRECFPKVSYNKKDSYAQIFDDIDNLHDTYIFEVDNVRYCLFEGNSMCEGMNVNEIEKLACNDVLRLNIYGYCLLKCNDYDILYNPDTKKVYATKQKFSKFEEIEYPYKNSAYVGYDKDGYVKYLIIGEKNFVHDGSFNYSYSYNNFKPYTKSIKFVKREQIIKKVNNYYEQDEFLVDIWEVTYTDGTKCNLYCGIGKTERTFSYLSN